MFFINCGHEMVKGSICQSYENYKVSPSKTETPIRKNTAYFKKYEKHIMFFLIIIFSVFTIGVFQERVILAAPLQVLVNRQQSKEAPIDPVLVLSDTPPSNLQPYGELYQVYKYNSYYTNVHREKTINEIKGKVVNWSLPIDEIDGDGDGYIVKTSETIGFWLFGKKVVKTEIRLLPRGPHGREYIESLKTGDMITFKGLITGISSIRRIEINPAIIVSKP